MARHLVSNRTCHDLVQARDFLADCYRQPVKLEDAAAVAHLSSWHFLREFRRAFQETPHEFVTRLRVEQAKTLLATTSLSVTQICLDLGYSSLGSFSTLFARRVGVSPNRYRCSARTVVTVPGQWSWLTIPFCCAAAFGPLGR